MRLAEFGSVDPHRLRLLGLQNLRLQGAMQLDERVRIEAPGFFASAVRLDTPVSIGAFGLFNGGIIASSEIGRYASFGSGTVLGSMEHPIDWVTSSTVGLNTVFMGWDGWYERHSGRPVTAVARPFKGRPITTVGHDVWLGQNAFIKAGVTIGTGAVVAAGAVVAKDVPPYAIVGGVPAKLIRYRFPERTIEKLLASEWWRYSIYDINFPSLTDPERFVEDLAEAVSAGRVPPFEPPVWTTDNLIRTFAIQPE